jgi:hypothetical protein
MNFNNKFLKKGYQMKSIFIFGLLVLINFSAHAESKETVKDVFNSYSEVVLGACYHNLDDLSKVESMARVSGWTDVRDISEDIYNIQKPKEGEGYAAWIVPVDEENYVVSINSSTEAGEKTNVCVVIVPNAKHDEVVKKLAGSFILDEIHMGTPLLPGQRTTVYNIENAFQPNTALMISSIQEEELSPVNISLFSIQKTE